MANYKVYFIIIIFADVCKEDKYTNIMLNNRFR
jgi:hypothetical protein